MRPSRILRLGASALLSLVLTAAIAPVASAADPSDPSVPGAGASHGAAVAATQFTGPAASKARPTADQGSAATPAVPGYTISGTVTAKGGGPLANVQVCAYSHTTEMLVTWQATAADGTYTIPNLPADDYVVWFNPPDNTFYRGAYSGGGVPVVWDQASVVPLQSGNATGINAQLQQQTAWSVTIDTSPSKAVVGNKVRISATANHDVELTYYYILIYGSTTSPLGCDSGSICYIDDTEFSVASRTYHATIAEDPDKPAVATSGSVTANWVVASTYHAITPKRLLDTRDGTGGLSGPFTNHAPRTFQVTGGDPTGVPTGATAVTGNLTVTGQTSNGYLFIGPDATTNPTSSTLNFPKGDDRANAVTVALSATGSLSITFVAPANGPVAHAIFDVTGYFTADATGATYHPLTPTRLLDSRNGIGLGLSGSFSNHAPRTFQVTGGSSPVPAGAVGVTGNLTVTSQTSNGYLYLSPVATTDPKSSTLNFPRGDDRANAVTVALGDGGTLSITFVAPTNGPTADVIFDVTGYFTADLTGGSFIPLPPKRLLDTRDGTGGLSGPFTNHASRTFLANQGVLSDAIAVTGNLTVTGQTSNGYLFISPAMTNNPTSSTLNFPRGDDRANAVTVATGSFTTGMGPQPTLSITFVAPTNGPTAHGIFDLTGYFVVPPKF